MRALPSYLAAMSTATRLADRALIRLSGEDVAGFLQGLVTNDVALLAGGRPIWAALLTAQGKREWAAQEFEAVADQAPDPVPPAPPDHLRA